MRYNILLFIVILQHFRCGYEWASLLVCVCVGGGGGVEGCGRGWGGDAHGKGLSVVVEF